MTDRKTPDWVKEEALDLIRSVYPVVDEDERPYIPADELPTISQALLSAYERGRKEGIEEAAKVAEERDPHWPDDGDHIARTIRQLLEVKG
jgi:hypothetical protein